MGRFLAGMRLAAIVATWLVLWLPLAVYCLVAIATAPLWRAKAPSLYSRAYS